jgi:hypothetical protein
VPATKDTHPAKSYRKPFLLPSDLLGLASVGRLPGVRVSVDTETSGLRTDEGARISTVSVGWIDWDRKWEHIAPSHQWAGGIQTWREEVLVPGEPLVGVVSFAWPFDQGVSGTGKPEDVGQESLWPDAENLDAGEWAALLDWLDIVGEAQGLVMANMKFDLHMFVAGVRRWPGLGRDFLDLVVWDTQNGNDLFFGFLPSTSLKGPGTATELLWGKSESDEKTVISKYLVKKKLPKGRWDLMPWAVIARYADQDARLTARLQYAQFRRMDSYAQKPHWDKWFWKPGTMSIDDAFRRRMAVTRMLFRMEQRGLPFSVSAARDWADALKGRALAQAVKLPFKPATIETAKHYWFGTGIKKGVEGLGQPPISTTPTGAPSLTQDDVSKLIKAELPGAEVWRSYSKLTRADSMWYTGWAQKAGSDDRLRTSVRQNGTRSGRFSVEGIQLQAIPHDYKLEGFAELEGIPSPRALIGQGVPEGYQLWELDLANAEARVAALFAGCKRMLEMIDAGLDLHGETAKELFHVKPEDVDWGEKRQVAKRGNFSLIFGVGWEKLQNDIEEQTGIRLGDHETKTLINKWHALYPEYKKAINQHMDQVTERQKKRSLPGSYVETINGERRWFSRFEDAHKAFNQRVQANLGQFAVDWWLAADEICNKYLTEEELETCGIVLTVHDSTVLLLPDHIAEKVVRLVQEAGVRLWNERFAGVPGGVDASLWSEHS